MAEEQTKKWYQSKTLWVNALAIFAGLASWAEGQIAIGATLTIGGALNVVLRIVTKQAITA